MAAPRDPATLLQAVEDQLGYSLMASPSHSGRLSSWELVWSPEDVALPQATSQDSWNWRVVLGSA